MRRRQRHQELATAGGYAVPSLEETRGVGYATPEPARAPLSMLMADARKACPHCGKLCRPGALHFHLKRCENKGDVGADDPTVPDVRRS